MLDNKKKAKFCQSPFPYFNIEYDSKKRFCSYWHQINEIVSLKPNKVLDVGIGNGFVSSYLDDKGNDVTTLDVAHELLPNVTGSVLAIPFKSTTFDVVSCYEVLEHMPYREFNMALKELSRVSKRHIILSLPDATAVYRLNIELPRIKPVKKLIHHPWPRSKHHKCNSEHYWEIGKTGYKLNKIKFDIIGLGFNIIKSYRVYEYYRHRFFLLEKIV